MPKYLTKYAHRIRWMADRGYTFGAMAEDTGLSLAEVFIVARS